jgi:acyl-CoA reductase-like NAD-dependent aldehyde dehydrogenase
MMKEEVYNKFKIFGPILPIISFVDIKETVDFINNGGKPLAIYFYGSIWSKNIDILNS